ncbi:S24/S26 family peptidase [Natronorubrum thiooxidans]|uniref:Signal peptidase, endoplasmic reticulum-type n=1 Tax=Natronorubrum thiooxidans TaxID=308853 RepID=A0A1N7EZB9_9EURY|nr:S26 family signal peptidase [Natronorubrum thiooxidans]SIR93285.1 signal peptidase, endoplasmic reticulum-type [Natronorubrum thiooxidans]
MSGPSPGGPSDDADDSREDSNGRPTHDRDRQDSRDRNRQDRNSAQGWTPPGADDADEWTPPGEPSETPPKTTETDGVTIDDDGLVRWFLRSKNESVVLARDVASSVAIVAVIGLLLFGVSGIWPPLVAVESGSMEPNMQRGDLIFVVDDDRFAGDDPVAGTGVVTLEDGEANGHEKFGEAGDVIVFRPNGDPGETPVIHRAHFWVEEDENWVDTKANEEIIGDATCADVQTCPANHDGFITKGDANSGYDQYRGGARTDVVRTEWVTGKAMFRVPWLGHVRLTFDELFGGIILPSPVLESVPEAVSPDSAALQAGLAGSTGLAGTSAGVAVAVGRYRN